MRNHNLQKKLLTVFLFAVAMGILEAVVVVYLRELYYPEGFSFPLAWMPPEIVRVELIRELATLLMLLAIGFLAGKTGLERFSWFLYSFGIWDIVYYIGLKLFIGWPPSLLTWDILFLIPVVWTGPVLAPVICSLMMIDFSVITLFAVKKDPLLKPRKVSWFFIISGAVIVFASFIADAVKLIVQSDVFQADSGASDTDLINLMNQFVPDRFRWFLFGIGILIIFTGMLIYYIQIFQKKDELFLS